MVFIQFITIYMTTLFIPDFTPVQFVTLFLFGTHNDEKLMAWNELQNIMPEEEIAKLIKEALSK